MPRSTSFGMRKAPGFWKRPTSRTYAYNLDLGEHYYHPMTNYLEADRGTRGETPGALTYSERLARRWLQGRQEGQQESSYAMRASSLTRDAAPLYVASENYLDGEMSRRSAYASRARSEIGEYRSRTPAFEPAVDMNNVSAFAGYKQSLLDSSHELRRSSLARQSEMSAKKESQTMSEFRSRQASRHQAAATESAKSTSSQRTMVRRQISDDISKKVADVHMMPWNMGNELDEAQSASARARARINELERELEEITKRAISTQSHAMKTASQLAKEAMMEEDAMASAYKKTRKVTIESASKMARA